jgi:hypothetical protein
MSQHTCERVLARLTHRMSALFIDSQQMDAEFMRNNDTEKEEEIVFMVSTPESRIQRGRKTL